MTRTRQILTVAGWEFMRYFKLRQQIISLLTMALIVGGIYGGLWWFERAQAKQRFEIAVIGGEHLDLTPAPDSRLRLTPAAPTQAASLAGRVGRGELAGLLTITGDGATDLVVGREPHWLEELQTVIDRARNEQALAREGLDRGRLQALMASTPVQVDYHPDGTPPRDRNTRLFVMAALGLMLSCLFASFAYFFASITSEKQQRVSELVVSAIRPQTWMDGKILGLTLLGLRGLLGTLLWLVAMLLVYRASTSSIPAFLSTPPAAGDIAVLLAWLVLGLLFWNSFLAAAAATIDDPNSSSRSSLMLVPLIAPVLSFLGMRAPDSAGMLFLSWFPPTSWAAMPARNLLSPVPTWEMIGSLLLMALAVWWMRRLAGRIFAASILMYGKEPSWRMLWRTLRETDQSSAMS